MIYTRLRNDTSLKMSLKTYCTVDVKERGQAGSGSRGEFREYKCALFFYLLLTAFVRFDIDPVELSRRYAPLDSRSYFL